MKYRDVSDLCVSEIMRRWPATIGVFIDLRMHCIGCPIGAFHTLADAADEHAISLDRLTVRIAEAIGDGKPREAPARDRRRSAAGDAGP